MKSQFQRCGNWKISIEKLSLRCLPCTHEIDINKKNFRDFFESKRLILSMIKMRGLVISRPHNCRGRPDQLRLRLRSEFNWVISCWFSFQAALRGAQTGEKKILEMVIWDRQEITLLVLYLWITHIFHVQFCPSTMSTEPGIFIFSSLTFPSSNMQ